MSFYLKGGIPFVRRVSGAESQLVTFPSETLSLRIAGTAGVKIYFSADDAQADAHYATIPQSGVWEGGARCYQVWVQGGGDIEVTGFCLTR